MIARLQHWENRHHRLLRLLWVGLIVAMAAIPRLYIASDADNDYDEDEYIIGASYFRDIYDDGHWQKITAVTFNQEHPPLVKMLYAPILPEDELVDIPKKRLHGGEHRLPPSSHFNARLLSLIFGLVTIGVVGYLSPLAGFMLAIQSIHMHYTSVAYLDAFPVLMTTFSVIFYIKSHLYTQVPELSVKSIRYGFLSAFFLGAGVTAKYPFALVGIGLILYTLYHRRHQWHQAVIMLAKWGGFSLLIFFLLNPYLWANPIARLYFQLSFHQDYASGHSQDYHYLELIIQLSGNQNHWSHLNLAPWLELFLLSDFLIFFFAIIGTARLWRENPMWFWVLAIGFIFLMIWPTQWIQHKMIIIVPYCLSASLGLKWAVEKAYQLVAKVKLAMASTAKSEVDFA